MVESEPFDIAVYETDAVPSEVFEQVRRVFGENYREANFGYLEKNLGKLRYLSVARAHDGTVAGFALAEGRVLDLPQLPETNVQLHGLSCVGAEFRRHGLFGRLERAAMAHRELPTAERTLGCGRCAHPASFRGFFNNPAAVPHRSRATTEWQQEVGAAIAEAYGSPGFDPVTFVVRGSGVPIGWPIIEIEATEEEWAMFAPVDRSKGESLLGIAWRPAPPPGWFE